MSGYDWTFLGGCFFALAAFLGALGLIIYAADKSGERDQAFRLECVKQGGTYIGFHCIAKGQELKK